MQNGGFLSTFGALALAPIPEARPQVADVKPLPHLVALPTPVSPGELVAQACQAWGDELRDQIGGSPQNDMRTLGANILELTTAHPSGSAQLFAGRSTRLSSLFRDERALLHAMSQADLVMQYLENEARTHGICTLYLASGVATWMEQPPVIEPDADAMAGGVITTNDEADGLDTLAQVANLNHNLSSGSNSTKGLADTAAIETSAAVKAKRDATKYPVQVRVPVLLHPVTLEQRRNGEFELNLEGQPQINPVLAAKIRAAGGLLDPETLAESTTSPSGFAPVEALNRIEALGGAVFQRFELVRRCIVGAFTHPGQQAAADLAQLEPQLAKHEVVKALAGDESARASLGNVQLPTFQPTGALGNRGVGDLSPAEQQALVAVQSGKHLFLNTPIGADSEALVAAILADAAAQGKSVLHVSGQRRVGANLKKRMAAQGLDGMILDVPATPAWRAEVNRRLLSSMTQEVEADVEFANTDEYIGVFTQLDSYVHGLHRTHEPWGVSINQAFHQVAALTAAEAQTTVRFAPTVLRSLSLATRERLNTELALAAQTGAFQPEIVNSPWYGAKVADHSHALAAHNRVTRLSQTSLPMLLERVAYISEYCGLGVANTLNEFGELLTMLGGMRGTLDIFLPQVFEHSVAELVVATSARKERAEKPDSPGALATRRLRKYARDMIRPGVRVNDLSAELAKVEAQRQVWAQYAVRPSYPVLPPGLGAIEELYEAVQVDLAALEDIIGAGSYAGAGEPGVSTTAGLSLADWSLLELSSHINNLAADTAALENLPSRERALNQLRRHGLGDLLDDLTERQVPGDLVAAEFDLAWWGSLLQTLLEQEPVVAQTSASRLVALTDRFRQLDTAYAEASGNQVNVAVRSRIRNALANGQLADLYSTLVAESVPPVKDLFGYFGPAIRLLQPVMMASPSLVPHLLPAEQNIDLLVLDGVQSQNQAELISAIGRSRQVVVVGDPQAASGNAIPALAQALTQVDLPAKAARRDGEVTRLLANHGYSGVLHGAPLPRSAAALHFEVVDGRGPVSSESDAVEAPEAEVVRAVELAVDHARYRPAESLAIVTLTQAHAEAVAAKLSAVVEADRSLAGYFGPNQPEPVVVCAANSVSGLHRDAVIFSVGLGRTPHGRVLHGFGPLSSERGVALLNGAIGVARKRMQVLSSFGVDDLDAERIHGEGPTYLFELLSLANKTRTSSFSRSKNLSKGMSESDSPLLTEVGTRLQQRGYLVEYKFGCRGGVRIPMVVGHPTVPQERLVAVLDDGPDYACESNLRTRDRHQPFDLVNLGWAVTQVWSVAAFLDPDAEADRIAELVEAALVERLSARTETAPVPVVPPAAVAAALESPMPTLTELSFPEPSLVGLATAELSVPTASEQSVYGAWEAPLENPVVNRNNSLPEGFYAPLSLDIWPSSESVLVAEVVADVTADLAPEVQTAPAQPEIQLTDYIAPVLLAE